MTEKKIVVAIDTETSLIRPGVLAPELVCVSWALYSYAADDVVSGICADRESILANVGQWLSMAADHDEILIVGHNVSFDMAVLAAWEPSLLPKIFAAYKRKNIDDTKLREQLIDIAEGQLFRGKKGKYSLASLSEKYLGLRLSKGEDTWRLRYEELRGIPVSDWPSEAVEYARMDADSTFRVYAAQLSAPIATDESAIPNSLEQAQADWALHLMSCWGVVTDKQRVKDLGEGLFDSLAELRQRLQSAGLIRRDGTKDMKKIRALVTECLGSAAPTTPKGAIKTDDDTLTRCDEPNLQNLTKLKAAEKIQSTWMKHLERGTHTPIQCSYNTLVESGRTSCRGPNLQNPHRATGLRECFVPRDGYLYIACDYSTLELCTLAQVNEWLFGNVAMAKKLREGVDLHLHFAAQMLGITYGKASTLLKARDPGVKKARQLAKVANFGYPGGMGPKALVSFAKGSGVDISLEQAEQLREDWFRAWPEMRSYFKFVTMIIGNESGAIEQFVSDRKRGDVRFTQACNSYFQGLAADGAKAAAFEVSRRCYAEPSSKLYGSRPVMFIHDEIIIEAPEELAAEAGDELAAVMRAEMKVFTPDIPIKTSVAMMDRWYKDAEEVRDREGRLVVWEPSKF